MKGERTDRQRRGGRRRRADTDCSVRQGAQTILVSDLWQGSRRLQLRSSLLHYPATPTLFVLHLAVSQCGRLTVPSVLRDRAQSRLQSSYRSSLLRCQLCSGQLDKLYQCASVKARTARRTLCERETVEPPPLQLAQPPPTLPPTLVLSLG